MPALAEGFDLAAFYVALGLCIIAIYVVRALFGAAGSSLGWIPWVGSSIKGTLHSIEQKLTNELAKVVSGLDGAIAWQWHKLAQISAWIGDEIKQNAAALLSLAGVIVNPLLIPAWRALWNQLHVRVNALPHIAEGIAHDATKGIAGELHTLERWTLPRVKTLEREIEHTIPRDIAGLRSRAKALEGEYAKLYRLIKAQVGKWDLTLFAGAVAVALARLGLSWIRCENVKTAGRALCGLPQNLLGDFLALLADFFIVANICQVIPWLEEGFSVVAAPLVSALTAVGAGLCDPGASPPELLPETTLYLPASTAVTLSLP